MFPRRFRWRKGCTGGSFWDDFRLVEMGPGASSVLLSRDLSELRRAGQRSGFLVRSSLAVQDRATQHAGAGDGSGRGCRIQGRPANPDAALIASTKERLDSSRSRAGGMASDTATRTVSSEPFLCREDPLENAADASAVVHRDALSLACRRGFSQDPSRGQAERYGADPLGKNSTEFGSEMADNDRRCPL